jgi:hypothetical protein
MREVRAMRLLSHAGFAGSRAGYRERIALVER